MVILGTLLLLGAGYMLYAKSPSSSRSNAYINAGLLQQLPQRKNSKITTIKAVDTIVPPTNSWIAGAVFHTPAQTVYPYPHSIKMLENGLEIGLPNVTSNPKTISGQHTQLATVTVPGATTYELKTYDGFHAVFSFMAADVDVATVSITRGSPYVFIQPKGSTEVSVLFASPILEREDSYIRSSGDTGSVALRTRSGTIGISEQTATIPARSGELITLYTFPAGTEDELRTNANNDISGVKIEYVDRGTEMLTAFEYKTRNGQPTTFVTMPHQKITDSTKLNLAYETIYGTASAYSGHDMSFRTPKITPSSTLNVKNLDESERARLRSQLSEDVQATTFDATDTYFSGKQLYRAANLLQLAVDLDDETAAEVLRSKLNTEFDLWFDPNGASKRDTKYFYYDTTTKGLIGQTASFGSDEYNDHHFHYGYFIYAASVLAANDPNFIEKHGDFVSLLTADIAATNSNRYFPVRRTFDAYGGHSWASGTAPFADGNNQESVSEAINAWSAVALWSKETGNKSMNQQAIWMLSSEAASMNAYWLNYTRSEKPYVGYDHAVTPLNWGGKRDYATFFSDAASAKLGIVLLPMNPTFQFLSEQKGRISTNVREALANGTRDVQFGDYITMYESLGKNTTNYEIASRNISSNNIDGANSKSYMLAWILSQSNK